MNLDPEILLQYTAQLDAMSLLAITSFFVLLLCSALISGTEVAFFSLSKTDIIKISDETNGQNPVVLLLQNPSKLLATILITNNFINILIVLIFASLGEVFLKEENLSLTILGFILPSSIVKFSIEVLLVTFFILLFGEVLPKVYASRRALKFCNLMCKPLQFLTFFLTPLSFPLINLTNVIEKKLGSKNSNFSVEILSKALELTSEGSTTKEEKKILEGIVSFGNTETVQIMKPRIDIFALSHDETYDDVLTKILKHGYSRNPVYKNSIDNIIGVLYAKDLLGFLDNKDFNWQELLREPFFVPENKKLDDLLVEFRERKNHLAIVVDEYGGTSGIVTLEDVIEEIVGEINDEFDTDDLSYSKIDANNYIFDGKITIKDFCKVLEEPNEEKFEEYKGESETIAGFILEISGKFPKIGEKINFDRYVFTIEALDRKRIKQLKVTRHHE